MYVRNFVEETVLVQKLLLLSWNMAPDSWKPAGHLSCFGGLVALIVYFISCAFTLSWKCKRTKKTFLVQMTFSCINNTRVAKRSHPSSKTLGPEQRTYLTRPRTLPLIGGNILVGGRWHFGAWGVTDHRSGPCTVCSKTTNPWSVRFGSGRRSNRPGKLIKICEWQASCMQRVVKCRLNILVYSKNSSAHEKKKTITFTGHFSTNNWNLLTKLRLELRDGKRTHRCYISIILSSDHADWWSTDPAEPGLQARKLLTLIALSIGILWNTALAQTEPWGLSRSFLGRVDILLSNTIRGKETFMHELQLLDFVVVRHWCTARAVQERQNAQVKSITRDDTESEHATHQLRWPSRDSINPISLSESEDAQLLPAAHLTKFYGAWTAVHAAHWERDWRWNAVECGSVSVRQRCIVEVSERSATNDHENFFSVQILLTITTYQFKTSRENVYVSVLFFFFQRIWWQVWKIGTTFLNWTNSFMLHVQRSWVSWWTEKKNLTNIWQCQKCLFETFVKNHTTATCSPPLRIQAISASRRESRALVSSVRLFRLSTSSFSSIVSRWSWNELHALKNTFPHPCLLKMNWGKCWLFTCSSRSLISFISRICNFVPTVWHWHLFRHQQNRKSARSFWMLRQDLSSKILLILNQFDFHAIFLLPDFSCKAENICQMSCQTPCTEDRHALTGTFGFYDSSSHAQRLPFAVILLSMRRELTLPVSSTVYTTTAGAGARWGFGFIRTCRFASTPSAHR